MVNKALLSIRILLATWWVGIMLWVGCLILLICLIMLLLLLLVGLVLVWLLSMRRV